MKAGNGEVILTSEYYAARDGAVNGIERVRANAADVANFDTRTGKNGQQYFVLVAQNKQIIGKSEMYQSPSSVKRGITSVMRNSPTARVVELAKP